MSAQAAAEPRPDEQLAESMAEAVRRARQAQAPWRALPLTLRLAVLRRFRHLLAEGAAEVARAARVTAPVPVAETLSSEVLPLADACRFLEREAPALLTPRRVGRRGQPAWLVGVHSEVRREPFGVVLIVGPSNYPLMLPGVQTVQALAAGNAVLLKPGSGGTPAALQLSGLLTRSGLGAGLLTVLPETPAVVAPAVAGGVDKVVLTGSARTGRALLALLADRLVPATMELSGCDAVFVQPDADLDLVSRAVTFGLRWNGSETCIAPRRVFVPQQLAADLEQRLVRGVAALEMTEHRSASAQKAAALVEAALGEGARLAAGKVLPGGGGLTPCVVAGARPDMRLLREETFAPVVALVGVRDMDEAVRVAARCPYGLGASIFGDPAEARQLAGLVRAGSITVNDLIVPTVDPRLPFGGRGESGFGSTRGAEGLLEMTTPQVVSVRGGGLDFHLDAPRADDAEFFTRYIQAAHAASWTRRLAASWHVGRAVVRRVWERWTRGRGQ